MAAPPATFTDADRDHLNKLFDELGSRALDEYPHAFVEGFVPVGAGAEATLTITIPQEEP